MRSLLPTTNKETVPPPHYPYVAYSLRQQTSRVHVDSVICFKADRKYTDMIYYDYSGIVKTAIITDSVRALHERFIGFWRVHRGTIVNPKYASQLIREDKGKFVIMMDGSRLAISRRFWVDVRQQFKGVNSSKNV